LVFEGFGDGPETIVFVHDAGRNHLSWWNQTPRFQDDFRCATYEVRDWQQSQDLSGERLTVFSRDLGNLMDQLEISQTVLVGWSMGGFSVQALAARNYEHVPRLMIADTMVGICDDAMLGALQDSLAAADSTTPETWMTQMFGLAYVQRSPGGVFLYNQFRTLNTSPTNVGGYSVEDGAFTIDELKNLTMSVVLLVGIVDMLIPLPLFKRAADLIPHAKHVEVQTGSHSAYGELPDEFNRVLEELLAEVYD